MPPKRFVQPRSILGEDPAEKKARKPRAPPKKPEGISSANWERKEKAMKIVLEDRKGRKERAKLQQEQEQAAAEEQAIVRAKRAVATRSALMAAPYPPHGGSQASVGSPAGFSPISPAGFQESQATARQRYSSSPEFDGGFNLSVVFPYPAPRPPSAFNVDINVLYSTSPAYAGPALCHGPLPFGRSSAQGAYGEADARKSRISGLVSLASGFFSVSLPRATREPNDRPTQSPRGCPAALLAAANCPIRRQPPPPVHSSTSPSTSPVHHHQPCRLFYRPLLIIIALLSLPAPAASSAYLPCPIPTLPLYHSPPPPASPASLTPSPACNHYRHRASQQQLTRTRGHKRGSEEEISLCSLRRHEAPAVGGVAGHGTRAGQAVAPDHLAHPARAILRHLHGSRLPLLAPRRLPALPAHPAHEPGRAPRLPRHPARHARQLQRHRHHHHHHNHNNHRHHHHHRRRDRGLRQRAPPGPPRPRLRRPPRHPRPQVAAPGPHRAPQGPPHPRRSPERAAQQHPPRVRTAQARHRRHPDHHLRAPGALAHVPRPHPPPRRRPNHVDRRRGWPPHRRRRRRALPLHPRIPPPCRPRRCLNRPPANARPQGDTEAEDGRRSGVRRRERHPADGALRRGAEGQVRGRRARRRPGRGRGDQGVVPAGAGLRRGREAGGLPRVGGDAAAGGAERHAAAEQAGVGRVRAGRQGALGGRGGAARVGARPRHRRRRRAPREPARAGHRCRTRRAARRLRPGRARVVAPVRCPARGQIPTRMEI